MKPLFHSILLLLAVGSSACVIDTVPMPEERSRGDSDRDFNNGIASANGLQTDALFFSAGPVLLVGEASAARPERILIAENQSRPGFISQAPAAADGSFAMRLNAEVGDVLTLSMAYNGVREATIELNVQPGSVAAFAASSDLSESVPGRNDSDIGISISAPDASGLAHVTGAANSVAPGIALVLANLSRSAGSAVLAHTDGSFALQIAAKSGDELALFAVEPASSNGGGSPTLLRVP